MRTIALKINDDVYEKILAFLELLPKDKIEIFSPLGEIPFVDDQEQAELEELLKDPECHEYSGVTDTIEI